MMIGRKLFPDRCGNGGNALNKFIHISIALILLMLFFSACSPKQAQPSPTLEFCGIPWNSTRTQVMDALSLTDGDVTLGQETEGSVKMAVQGLEVLGTESVSVVFTFTNFRYPAQGDMGLSSILVYLMDSAGQEVYTQLTDAYGPGVDGYTSWQKGIPAEMTAGESERFFLSASLKEVLSEEVREGYRDYWMNCPSQEPLSEEGIEKDLSSPAVTVKWTDNAHTELEDIPEGRSRTAVLYNAGSYVSMLQQPWLK